MTQYIMVYSQGNRFPLEESDIPGSQAPVGLAAVKLR
jgi:hypothetical protein